MIQQKRKNKDTKHDFLQINTTEKENKMDLPLTSIMFPTYLLYQLIDHVIGYPFINSTRIFFICLKMLIM